MRFWLDRGVFGFRVDAISHLFEIQPNEEGVLPDEPSSGNTKDADNWSYLNHIFTYDQPETVDMVYQWRQVLDDYSKEHGGESRIMLTEAYSPLDVLDKYYGNATHDGSHVPFNFQLLSRITNWSNARNFISCFDDWMKIVRKNRVANWVMGNHDTHRVASRLGSQKIDAINMILLTLPGISINYNVTTIFSSYQSINFIVNLAFYRVKKSE